MVTGTFYLRPNADISLGHPVYPDTLTAGYLAISEEVSDGTSTYIGVTTSPDGEVSYSSSFKMALNQEARITKILSAKFGFAGDVNAPAQGDISTCSCTVTISGETVFLGELKEKYLADTSNTTDTLTNADMSNLATAINNYISANGTGCIPEIRIDITNTSAQDNGTKALGKSYVTQVYIVLECEYEEELTGLNIYHKVGGTWKQAQAAYQKKSGAWVETTEDECKAVLQSGLVLKQ